MNSFKIITICSKIVQITRIVFHFSERFILKVKTLQYLANGKLVYKTKIILPLAICKLSLFLLLVVYILCILKKKPLRYTIIRISEIILRKKQL